MCAPYKYIWMHWLIMMAFYENSVNKCAIFCSSNKLPRLLLFLHSLVQFLCCLHRLRFAVHKNGKPLLCSYSHTQPHFEEKCSWPIFHCLFDTQCSCIAISKHQTLPHPYLCETKRFFRCNFIFIQSEWIKWNEQWTNENREINGERCEMVMKNSQLTLIILF